MDQEQRKSRNGNVDEVEPSATATDRRKFLGQTFSAAPIILTLGNRRGWSGKSVHGTLWSSAGTDWKHRGGRWWRGRGWDKPKPPHSRGHEQSPWNDRRDSKPRSDRGDDKPPSGQPDWDWQAPREDWRKWRPHEDDSQKPEWQWGRAESKPPVVEDVPVNPIEETIRKKD